jgi:AcrR family transcriptional regulator
MPQTKKNIIEVAKILFWKYSINLVSVDQICKEASIQKGSFYYHFSSKLELCLNCIESHFAEHESTLKEIFSADHDPIKRIELYAQTIYEKQVELKAEHKFCLGCPYNYLNAELEQDNLTIQAKIVETYETYINYFKQTLDDAIALKVIKTSYDSSKLARQMFSYSMGVLNYARTKNEVEIIKEDLEPGLKALMCIC